MKQDVMKEEVAERLIHLYDFKYFIIQFNDSTKCLYTSKKNQCQRPNKEALFVIGSFFLLIFFSVKRFLGTQGLGQISWAGIRKVPKHSVYTNLVL